MLLASGGSPILGASLRVCAVARLPIRASVAASAAAAMAWTAKRTFMDLFSQLSFLPAIGRERPILRMSRPDHFASGQTVKPPDRKPGLRAMPLRQRRLDPLGQQRQLAD